jgi:hypothetical protein
LRPKWRLRFAPLARPRCIEAASAKSSSIASQKIFQLRLQCSAARRAWPAAGTSIQLAQALLATLSGVMLKPLTWSPSQSRKVEGKKN